MTSSLRLSDISRCFQGIVPSIIATSDSRGVPNITYLSQVYLVDDGHVALSCQFFNKTRRNLDENPVACVEVLDPLTLQAYRLRLRFLRSEKSGPLFEGMALRIDAIASHTGMSGVFRLIAADVFAVDSVECVEGFLSEPTSEPKQDVSVDGMRTEVRGLQFVSERINRATDLESLLTEVLEALEDYFRFAHTSVLLWDEAGRRLVTLASNGYGESGIGAEVGLGEGLIGTVARERKLLRLTSLEGDLRYARAIRRETAGDRSHLDAEIPLPGLPDAQSILALPLTVGSRLIGVFMAEDRDPMRFGEWHEAYLEIIANQIALGIDRMLERSDDAAEPIATSTRVTALPAPARTPATSAAVRCRRFIYYKSDDAIFVDDEYLIRNIPARILWKVLGESKRTGRTDFSNREMRLDSSLGLPPIKDNLESRLILLRHRLQEKCPDLQIVSTARGRFALRAEANIELVER
jgi:GAF domain-containing protein/pyridoxamine 5'-phosphate oxidase-like protein